MAFREMTIEALISELSSKAPVPGGGGASALVGALSASLTRMVAALTVGKPKYAAVEEQMNALLDQTRTLADRFLSLMDEDAAAFESLANAYRMPKDTQEQRDEKTRIMENALKYAVQPPMRIMEACAEAIPLISLCAEKGSVIAVSDAGVAATFCRAALEGASLNVFINTQAMQDHAHAEAINERAQFLLEEYVPLADELYRSVFSRLRKDG